MLPHKPFPCDFNTRILNCTSAPRHRYWQLILLLETTERWQMTVFLFTSMAVPSSLARQVEVFCCQSPDGWSLFQSGVLLESFCFICHHGHSSRVSHTFNYDVTVSSGVNLCHPYFRLGTSLGELCLFRVVYLAASISHFLFSHFPFPISRSHF